MGEVLDKYIGKRLDARYEVHELIGVGGMSLVYRAYDVIEAKNVAIKILKDEYFGNKDFMRRFKNESRAVAVLSHPNIVKVLNVSFGTNFQYIVMEYVSGITLKEYISKTNRIDWRASLAIIKQVLLALSHAHSKGIIHRDIKPQNIMITDGNVVKVTDFGIARFFNNETQTITDRTIGSVHYISPEQAKGLKTDVKSDIYSVGVLLYEMLTNRLPFEADNAVSVAIMQMQVSPQSPRIINSSIPVALEEITLKAMQKNPENRYSSVESMLNDIEKFEANSDVKFGYNCFVDNNPTKVLSKDESDEYDDEEKSKKKKTLFIVGGIASTLVLFALAFMFMTMFTSYGVSKSVDVPNFIGMKASDVQNNKDYKFKFQIENVYDHSKDEGIIIDQEPRANSKKIKSDGTVTLKVNSSGVPVAVPRVVGLGVEEAKSKISDVGLTPDVVLISDQSVPAGKVKTVDPSEGVKVSVNSIVKIYVSKGVSNIKIPNVIGQTFEKAKSEIESQGLKVDTDIKYEKSNKDKDIVLKTDPLPGVSVDAGTYVKLTLSSGERKEKKIELIVDWSDIREKFDKDIVLKVYVDGELDNSKTTTVDSSVTSKKFYFSGSKGKKYIKVRIKGSVGGREEEYIKEYEIDFGS